MDVTPSVVGLASVPVKVLRRAHFFSRLSRAWDFRFESLARTGQIGRWYSAVGNELATVGAALALAPNDALSTVHRDLGAILTTYLDPTRLAPELFDAEEKTDWDAFRPQPLELLHKLAAQVLGRRDGFTRGVDRSFHYGLLKPEWGVRHVGMISHLGAMIPVAAGLALAAKQQGSNTLALGFIGEGATSQGDFHEAMNLAGVLKLPMILVIENNQYAFSTPVSEQYACERLSLRAVGYGIDGVTVDGGDFGAVWSAVTNAVERARRGDGASMIEVILPRMRGHAEGDGSYEVIPQEERERFLAMDPLVRFESELVEAGVIDQARVEAVTTAAKALVEDALEWGRASAEPEVTEARRPVFAPGQIAEAFAKQSTEVQS